MALISVPVPVVLMLSGLSIAGSDTTATSKPFVMSEPARSTSRVNVFPTVYCVPPNVTGPDEHPVGAVVRPMAGSMQTRPFSCAWAGVEAKGIANSAAMNNRETNIILLMITPIDFGHVPWPSQYKNFKYCPDIL